MFLEFVSLLFACHTLFWIWALGWRKVTLAWYNGPVQISMSAAAGFHIFFMGLFLAVGLQRGFCSGSDVWLWALNGLFAGQTWFWAAWHYEWLDLKRVVRMLTGKHTFDKKAVRNLCWSHGIYAGTLERLSSLHAEKSPILGEGAELPETFGEYLALLLKRDSNMTKKEKDSGEIRWFFRQVASIRPLSQSKSK